MKDGFIRVAAATPDIHVADPQYNSEQIIELMEQGSARGVKVMVFPELCLTAYTCSDLFLQETLLKEAKNGLKCILQSSKSKDMVLFVGMPWMHKGKLYNVAAVVNRGRILGIVPKKHLPNYSEFYAPLYTGNGKSGDDRMGRTSDPYGYEAAVFMPYHAGAGFGSRAL